MTTREHALKGSHVLNVRLSSKEYEAISRAAIKAAKAASDGQVTHVSVSRYMREAALARAKREGTVPR